MKSKRINDKILLFRLSQKDKQAFVKTYDLYFDQIYRFVYFKVASKEDAEDLTSAVFLKTWGYIQSKSIKNYKTLKSLLYKVARNLVIDYYRKKSAENNNMSIDQENKLDFSDKEQNIHKNLERKTDYQYIENKLLELKDEYREIIIMRYVDELSIREIALTLDKKNSNVRVTLYRALRALRKIVSK